jgi:hypothetical protein
MYSFDGATRQAVAVGFVKSLDGDGNPDGRFNVDGQFSYAGIADVKTGTLIVSRQ